MKQLRAHKPALDYLNQLLKDDKPIGGQQLASLIELVGESREKSLLQRISPDILQLFPRLTCKTQSHFLQVFHRMSDYPSFTYLGKQLLELMTERGVRANAMCYTSLIKICTVSDDLDSALAVWELMKQRQVRPDVHVFTSLLAACAIKRGNEEKAEALLKEMEQFGVEPNLHLYSALIDVYAKTTNISRAFATLEAMVQKDMRPNVWTFSTLIDACARVHDLLSAWAIMRIMEKCEVRPNAHTYTTLIHACRNKPQYYTSAMELFEKAQRENCATLPLLTAVLGLAITRYDLHVANSAAAIIKQKGWQPEGVVYTFLLCIFAHRGEVELAYETLLGMPKHGVVPTLRHLNTVLGACVKTRDKHKIVALTELIGRLGKRPDRATYTSFMFLHYRLRRPDEVWATYQDCLDHGFKPDAAVYQALISVSWSKDDPAEMVEIFEEMKSHGVEPDEQICDTALAEVEQRVSSLPQDLHRPWKRILAWSLLDVTCVHLLRAIASDTGARATAEFVRDLDDHHDLRPRETSATTLLWLCALSHDRDGAQLVARAMADKGLDAHSVLSAFVGTMCQRDQPEAVLEVLEVLEQHASAQVARPDLERLFGAAVSKGHLPTATRAFAALEALGTDDEDLARWRAALRSVEDEERLRAELAAEPHTHTPSRKYALFKSSLSDPLPPHP